VPHLELAEHVGRPEQPDGAQDAHEAESHAQRGKNSETMTTRSNTAAAVEVKHRVAVGEHSGQDSNASSAPTDRSMARNQGASATKVVTRK
jgi:hypothetical protein